MMNWRLVQCLPRLRPQDGWDRLQHAGNLECTTSGDDDDDGRTDLESLGYMMMKQQKYVQRNRGMVVKMKKTLLWQLQRSNARPSRRRHGGVKPSPLIIGGRLQSR